MTCENSPSSPEPAADCSAASSSDGEQLPLLKTTPIARESSVRGAATWPTPQAQMPGAGPDNSKVQNLLTGSRHSLYLTHAIEAERQSPGLFSSPSTPTSAPSTPYPDRATSSPAGFPASRTVRPGSASAAWTPETSGLTPFAYCKSLALPSGSSRTYPVSSQAEMPMDEACSAASLATFPKRGSMRSGACWERTMSAPRIDASGCGYWPTARTTGLDGGSNSRKAAKARGMWPTATADDANNVTRDSGQFQSLTRVARGQSTPQTWGTPTSRDHKDTGTMENVPENALLGRQVLNRQKPWPTPRAANPGSRPNGKGGEILAEQARLSYATPRAEDSQCAGRRLSRDTSDTLYAQTVTDTNATPGSLSPLWVEWLQGFPPEWTDCAASVTPSVLRRWLRRSRCWLRLLGYEVNE